MNEKRKQYLKQFRYLAVKKETYEKILSINKNREEKMYILFDKIVDFYLKNFKNT